MADSLPRMVNPFWESKMEPRKGKPSGDPNQAQRRGKPSGEPHFAPEEFKLQEGQIWYPEW